MCVYVNMLQSLCFLSVHVCMCVQCMCVCVSLSVCACVCVCAFVCVRWEGRRESCKCSPDKSARVSVSVVSAEFAFGVHSRLVLYIPRPCGLCDVVRVRCLLVLACLRASCWCGVAGLCVASRCLDVFASLQHTQKHTLSCHTLRKTTYFSCLTCVASRAVWVFSC